MAECCDAHLNFAAVVAAPFQLGKDRNLQRDAWPSDGFRAGKSCAAVVI